MSKIDKNWSLLLSNHWSICSESTSMPLTSHSIRGCGRPLTSHFSKISPPSITSTFVSDAIICGGTAKEYFHEIFIDFMKSDSPNTVRSKFFSALPAGFDAKQV